MVVFMHCLSRSLRCQWHEMGRETRMSALRSIGAALTDTLVGAREKRGAWFDGPCVDGAAAVTVVDTWLSESRTLRLWACVLHDAHGIVGSSRFQLDGCDLARRFAHESQCPRAWICLQPAARSPQPTGPLPWRFQAGAGQHSRSVATCSVKSPLAGRQQHAHLC